MKVVNTKFGKGKLFLIGGIMINMPEPYVDHFMPLPMPSSGFERQTTPQGPHGGGKSGGAEGKSNDFNMDKERCRSKDTLMEQSVFSWLSWSPEIDSPLAKTLQHHFPGALPGHAVHERMRYELEQSYGF